MTRPGQDSGEGREGPLHDTAGSGKRGEEGRTKARSGKY